MNTDPKIEGWERERERDKRRKPTKMSDIKTYWYFLYIIFEKGPPLCIYLHLLFPSFFSSSIPHHLRCASIFFVALLHFPHHFFFFFAVSHNDLLRFYLYFQSATSTFFCLFVSSTCFTDIHCSHLYALPFYLYPPPLYSASLWDKKTHKTHIHVFYTDKQSATLAPCLAMPPCLSTYGIQNQTKKTVHT